jgi:hypothetical protein
VSGGPRVDQDYRVAFLRFLDHGEESALATGYDIGRRALGAGLPLLDLARVHHEVVIEVLAEPQADPVRVAEAASAFLLEVLAPYEMSRRSADPQNGSSFQGGAGHD